MEQETDNELLINLLSKNRLEKYLLFTNNDINKSIELYNLNLKLSESLYTPLSYFEIFLRNTCNDKLKKELGDYWFDNEKVMISGNKIKDSKVLDKINKAKNEVIQNKKRLKINNYIPTNSDIVSNLPFGFWTYLLYKNYELKIWNPYLKLAFNDFDRKELYKNVDTTRELRNRIFHYEPIIFDRKLEEKYNNIISTIYLLSNQEICDYIEKFSNFRILYEEIKKSGDLLK